MIEQSAEISSNSDSSTSPSLPVESGAVSRRKRRAQARVREAQLQREVTTLRLAGVSYDKIAIELKLPSAEKPDGTAVKRIWMRALKKMEMPNVAEARIVHLSRLEQGFFNLQKKDGGWKEGKPRAIEVGLQLLDQEARLINTYPAPNVNLPSQNVNVTVVDRVEFAALPEPAGNGVIDVSGRPASETDRDARSIDEPERQDFGRSGSDRDGQDVVRADLDVGPLP